MLRVIALATILSFISCSHHTKENKPVKVYVYHDFAPFVIEEGAELNLSEQFFQKLEAKLAHKNLELVRSTKVKVIDSLLKGDQVMILWVNPKWFYKYRNHLISSSPILWDSDYLLSRKNSPVEFNGGESLYGLTQCSVAGHIYKSIDPYLKSGKVKIIERPEMKSCVDAVSKGKADYVVIEKSAWLNMFTPNTKKNFSLSKNYIDGFSRGMLLSKDLKDLLPEVNELIDSLPESTDWKNKMQRIGGKEFYELFNLDISELLKMKTN
ncbi:MAG: hypothetical protein BM556_01635 [Bacteriovorax sp. MedPE-SWde]|nr:MAG: hypothetical protein BM556_01635 [Bacteriovorax sp. MedPE-SWde]